MIKKFVSNIALLVLASGLVACGSVNVDNVLPDKKVEYKRERQAEKNLEIPPDLDVWLIMGGAFMVLCGVMVFVWRGTVAARILP